MDTPPPMDTTVTVRPAAAADVPAVDALLRAAFPDPAEAGLVQQLCADGDMVLMLVAEAAGEPVGVAAWSRMDVASGGRAVPAAALAPLATAADARGRGVADALVRAGLEVLEHQGFVLCFVLGDPAFYARFGFAADLARGYASPYAGDHLMAAALQGGLVPCGPRGEAAHAPAFAALAAGGA